MNKIYLVNHCFDVDGGFGDAILQEEVICGFDNREDADEFVEKYSNKKYRVHTCHDISLKTERII